MDSALKSDQDPILSTKKNSGYGHFQKAKILRWLPPQVYPGSRAADS